MSRLIALLSLFCMVALGCQHTKPITPPVATVLSVVVTQQTQDGARLEILLGVANPNLVPLPLVHAQYAVTVDGQGPFPFTDRPHRTAPAGVAQQGSHVGQQTVRLPVAITWKERPLRGATYRVVGAIHYDTPTSFPRVVTGPVTSLPAVAFDRTGVLE